MSFDWEVVAAGGGAAGFFGAIGCAERGVGRVLLLEATAHVLGKVRISGGGRCNVTHACFEVRELANHYPRGARELLGPFHRWQPRDTVEWFAAHGVRLKTEADGRMFPASDTSATVVDCLTGAARAAGVVLRTGAGIRSAVPANGGFALELTSGERLTCRRLLLATGGTRGSAGFAIAESLGHTIEPLVPSLFTFHVDDARLKGLEGISVPAARVAVAETGDGGNAAAASRRWGGPASGGTPLPRSGRLESEGALLITHGGLSGPAVLKLSAWGAREFAACHYRFGLALSWIGRRSVEEAQRVLEAARTGEHRRQLIANWNPFQLPARLWERLAGAASAGAGGRSAGGGSAGSGSAQAVGAGGAGAAVVRTGGSGAAGAGTAGTGAAGAGAAGAGAAGAGTAGAGAAGTETAGVGAAGTETAGTGAPGASAAGAGVAVAWATAGNGLLQNLARQTAAMELWVTGKSLNKEEFVTCGGVRLSEVDFRSMESKRCPGLHFAGEILDIDGLTGGFNFQAAWTTSWIAAEAMAAALTQR